MSQNRFKDIFLKQSPNENKNHKHFIEHFLLHILHFRHFP
jgi:hypothetical protein